jgi:glycerol-3-phosphate dehydrogenase
MPDSGERGARRLSERLAARERSMHDDVLICECEMVTRGMLSEAIQGRPNATLDDLRRLLRLGMGPCQGGFCGYRAAALCHEIGGVDARAANRLLRTFLENRWLGLEPILYGDQVRQAVLDEWIFQGLLDVDHLPLPDPGPFEQRLAALAAQDGAA